MAADLDADASLAEITTFLTDTLDVIKARRTFATWMARPSDELIEEIDGEVDDRLRLLADVLCARLGLRLVR